MKNFLTFIILIVANYTCYAQSSQISHIEYDVNYSSVEFYNGYEVTPNYSSDFTKEDLNGDIIVGFNIRNSVEEFEEHEFIGNKIVIRKYDKCYNELWTVIIDQLDKQDYLLYDLEIDENNDIYFCGSSTMLVNSGTRTFFGKINSNGSIAWTNFYGTHTNGELDVARGIDAENGKVFVIGTHNVSSFSHGFLAQYESNSGVLIWDDIITYPNIDALATISLNDIDVSGEIVAFVGWIKTGVGPFVTYHGVSNVYDLSGSNIASYVYSRNDLDYCKLQRVIVNEEDIIMGGEVNYIANPNSTKATIIRLNSITGLVYENEYNQGGSAVELKLYNSSEVVSSHNTITNSELKNIIYSTNLVTGNLNWATLLDPDPGSMSNSYPKSLEIDESNGDIYSSGNYGQNVGNKKTFIFRLDNSGNILNQDIINYDTDAFDAVYQNQKADNKALIITGFENPVNNANQSHSSIIYTLTINNSEECVTGEGEESQEETRPILRIDRFEILNTQGEILYSSNEIIDDTYFKSKSYKGFYYVKYYYNNGMVKVEKFINTSGIY